MQEKNPLRWWILLTVIIGTFLGRLDQTVVNLALPKIINDFSITVSAAGWIATAYILANAVFVPVWGKLGDTVGRKKIYLLGFGIFIVGSALAGLAWNLPSMIIFRIIQAIAGSADYPTAMAILAVTFAEGKERAQALGIWSSSFAVAAVFGPLIGGPLIDTLGWRSVFLMNIPVGILGLIMAMIFVEESKSDRVPAAFDWWGAIILGGALSSLVLVLDQGSGWGWTSLNSVLCYICVVIFTTIFYYIENGHPEPIVDLKFFRNATFVGTLSNNFVVFMGMMGSVFLVPIFGQTFLGYSATESGYLFIPMAFGLMLAAPLGGALTGRVRTSYVIAASTFTAGVGLFLLSYLDARSTAINIMIPMFVLAFGLGFGMSQRTNAVAAAVPPNEIGVASSVLALARNIAGAFGIALFGTLLTNTTNSNVLTIARNSSVNLHAATAGATQTMQTYIALIELKAQIDAYDTVFLAASSILFLGAIAALWLHVPERKLKAPIIVEG